MRRAPSLAGHQGVAQGGAYGRHQRLGPRRAGLEERPGRDPQAGAGDLLVDPRPLARRQRLPVHDPHALGHDDPALVVLGVDVGVDVSSESASVSARSTMTRRSPVRAPARTVTDAPGGNRPSARTSTTSGCATWQPGTATRSWLWWRRSATRPSPSATPRSVVR